MIFHLDAIYGQDAGIVKYYYFLNLFHDTLVLIDEYYHNSSIFFSGPFIADIIKPLWRIKTQSNYHSLCCALLSDLTFENKNPLIKYIFALQQEFTQVLRLKAYKERYLRSLG